MPEGEVYDLLLENYPPVIYSEDAPLSKITGDLPPLKVVFEMVIADYYPIDKNELLASIAILSSLVFGRLSGSVL